MTGLVGHKGCPQATQPGCREPVVCFLHTMWPHVDRWTEGKPRVHPQRVWRQHPQICLHLLLTLTSLRPGKARLFPKQKPSKVRVLFHTQVHLVLKCPCLPQPAAEPWHAAPGSPTSPVPGHLWAATPGLLTFGFGPHLGTRSSPFLRGSLRLKVKGSTRKRVSPRGSQN